jgi:type IV secretory pathway TrbD component
VTEEHSQAPPAGEEIHLPGPTVLPVVMAVGITFAVIGTTITWFLSIVGVVIFLVTLYMWIRDTRRDISELPEDHSAH